MTLTFGLIFNISFSAAPSLSTGRLALLLMTILYARGAFPYLIQFARDYVAVFALFIFLIPFSMVWLIVNDTIDNVMLSRALWFFIFSILTSFLFICLSRFDLISAMAYYLGAVFIQAIFVYASVLYPDFRNWVDQVLINSGNIDFSEGVRFAGLSNGGGAGLSLQLSLGVAASLVIFSRPSSGFAKFLLVQIALIITIATMFVGRTGFYISILMMLGFILLSGRLLFIAISIVTLIFVLLPYITSDVGKRIELQDNNANFDRTVNWAFDLFISGKSSSANALVSGLSKVRELSTTTLLIGSGRVIEYNGLNYSHHDSGYIHSLYSLGLPLSILFYFGLFYTYWKMLLPVRGKLKIIGLTLTLLVLLLEIKEPFIFKYTLPFFVLVYVYLARFNFGEQRLT